MTTTVAQILADKNARAQLSYVLEIEGAPAVLTTTDDVAGIATAGFGSAGNVWPLLRRSGRIARAIDLVLHGIQPASLTLEMQDNSSLIAMGASNLAAGRLAELFASENTACLTARVTANVNRTATTFPVLTTVGWPASGAFYNGLEHVTYASKDGTHFLGCTRGVYPFGNKASWAHDARAKHGNGPLLVSAPPYSPRVMKGRGVMLWATAKSGPDLPLGIPNFGGSTAWVSRANSVLLFAGTITQAPTRTREGIWSFTAESVEGKTKQTLLRNQFRGTASGFYLPATTLFAAEGDIVAGASKPATLTIDAGVWTLEAFISAINTKLQAARSGGALNYDWSIRPVASSKGQFYGVTVSLPASSADVHYVFSLTDGSPTSKAFDILGLTNGYGNVVTWIAVGTGSAMLAAAAGVKTATTTYFDTSNNGQSTIVLEAAPDGDFVGPADDDLPLALGYASGLGLGYVLIGDDPEPWAVLYDGDVTIQPIAPIRWDGSLRTEENAGKEVRVLEGQNTTIAIKQVWMAFGRVSRLLLRCLLSTGTSGYNYDGSGTNYDKWPAPIGCSIPSTLVDVASFTALDTIVGALATSLTFPITEPIKAEDLLQGICQTLGIHIAWANGKIRCLHPTHPGSMQSAWTLDTTNVGATAGTNDDAGSDLGVNDLALKCNFDPTDGSYHENVAYHDDAGQAEIEKGDAIEYDGRSLHDQDGSVLAAWLRMIAEPTCRYFGSGIWRYERSGSRGLIGIALGDITAFTEPTAFNPTTGTYGVSDARVWVVEHELDLELAEFPKIVVLMPGGNVLRVAASAMLDYSRGDFGYAVSGIPTYDLYLRDHEFSLSTEPLDVTNFVAGDKIRVIRVDPATPSAPTFTDVTVLLVGASFLRVSGPLGSAPTAHDRWYVIPQHYTSASSTQEEGQSFQGNALTAVIQSTSDPLVVWATHMIGGDGQTPDPTVRYRTKPDTASDDGAPLTAELVRDLALNGNALYANICTPQPVNDVFQADRTAVLGPDSIGLYTFIAGPYRVSCPPGATTLNIAMWVKLAAADGTGEYAVFTSPKLFSGAAFTVPDQMLLDLSQNPDLSTLVVLDAHTAYTRITGTIPVVADANGDSWLIFAARNTASGLLTGVPHVRSVQAWCAQRSLA